MNNFQNAMVFISKWEWGNRSDGGYTNDPTDPGGETKYGISKREYPNVDIQGLTLPDAMAIYLSDYWNANSLDSKPFPYSVALMDSAVNNGAEHMQDWDQQANGDYKALITIRRLFYLELIQNRPADIKYKNGWMNRINDLSKYCDILANPV